MKIIYLKNKDIDKIKWDNCLQNADNGLIYGCSWFLDIVCDSWDALIADDYKFVLPLPIKRKYFFSAVHKPVYVHLFSVFGKNVSSELVAKFMNRIPSKFISYTLNLSHKCCFDVSNIIVKQKVAQRLLLNKPYEQLFDDFEKSHRRNIRKSIKNNVKIKITDDINSVVLLKKEVLSSKNIFVPELDFEKLRMLLDYNFSNFEGEVYNAFYENKLIASAFFAKFKNQYTIFSGSDNLAKKLGANHHILNEFIKNHANSGGFLDFAGSNIDSIARWNLGFGAKNYFYFEYSKKLLPPLNFILKIFRK